MSASSLACTVRYSIFDGGTDLAAIALRHLLKDLISLSAISGRIHHRVILFGWTRFRFAILFGAAFFYGHEQGRDAASHSHRRRRLLRGWCHRLGLRALTFRSLFYVSRSVYL